MLAFLLSLLWDRRMAMFQHSGFYGRGCRFGCGHPLAAKALYDRASGLKDLRLEDVHTLPGPQKYVK